MQVTTEVKTRPPWIVRSMNSLAGAAMFVAPLLALVAMWAVVVPLFQINPRVFPSVGAVGTAALESIRDGTLVAHVGASLLRVGLGTLIGIVTAVPLGIAMGVSRAVATFLTPLFRFFSVLAGIAWIPIATLWFGYGFGAIVFVIFNAVFFVVAYNTLLGVKTIPLALRNAAASLGAGRWAMLTEVLLPGALPEYRHRHAHRAWLRMARPDRGRDDRDQCRARLHAVRGAGLLSHRGHRVRHDRDRRAVAVDRPPAAGSAGALDHRALGHGEARMSIWLQCWSGYVRATQRFPALAAIVPFIPVLALWTTVTEAGVFPRAFLPGPLDVVRSFVTLTYKGILPDYLQDSLIRLFTGAALGMAIGIPLGILIGTSRWAHRICWPILLFFQAIGDIAWLPILLIWFGFGLTTMTFVIVYTVLFPVVLNTVLGVESVPRDLRRAARSLGASPLRVLVGSHLPGALPNIITGLRNGLGYGWRALIAVEIIVGTSGIGFLMFDARRAGSTTEILLGMIILGLLWYIVDAWILAPLERATGQRWGLVTS